MSSGQEMSKLRRGRMVVSRFQGVVKDSIVFDGVLKGIPLPVAALKQITDGSQSTSQD